jgi:predicted MFS family arabinose efflux permease/outer membrane protein assembly factor BamB
MKQSSRRKILCAGLGINAALTIFLLLNLKQISLNPWNTGVAFDFPTFAAGNNARTAIIADSEKSVMVLNNKKELVCQIRADPGKQNQFSAALFAALDEENNLYVLDARFGGVLEDSVERVLRYSEKGAFLGEIYRFRYTNEDFILTKGKIAGMAYHGGFIYLLRLERNGFWLEWQRADGNGDTKEEFFDYPNAFRDLVYGDISAEARRITITTKTGAIEQFDFSGALIYARPDPQAGTAEQDEKELPWTAVSVDNNTLVYTDILTGAIFSLDTRNGARTKIYAAGDGQSLYYRINYAHGKLFAVSNDNIFINNIASGDSEGYDIIDSYTYTPFTVRLRILLFAGGALDILIFLAVVTRLGLFVLKKKLNTQVKIILITGSSIAFGGIIASFLIINEMNRQYNNKMFREIENISRMVSTSIDSDMLLSISSPADYGTEKYLQFKEFLTEMFSSMRFKGERIYQIIWTMENGYIYSLFDLESSAGTYFPFEKYADGPYKDVYESGEYVHVLGETTSEGSWLFVCGPIFDKDGNIIALIETGYDMRTVQEQTRSIIIQTLLIVVAASVAFLLAIIEFILVFAAWKKNKTEIEKKETPGSPPFYPELLRAIVFFLFIAGNLEAALLPTYAAQLYVPFLGLPKEFIVTLPIIADMTSATLALLIVPVLLEKAGLKPILLASVVFIGIGNILCFASPNTLYLAVAHIFIGFSGGSFLLAINTIIAGQQNIEDVNNGFAHLNASYLAGSNVGVVFGSILAQFFSYRMVYFFSMFPALVLIGITLFFLRSKRLNHIFNANVRPKKREGSLAGFLVKPAVLATLILLVIPYVASLSFASYFMPVYGIENGLRESNIGQLMLLNGLFAILFGAPICGFVAKKIPIKLIIILSLVLNAGAIYLFSLNMSVNMLVIVIFILAIINIFTTVNIQTYYTTLYQDTGIASSKTLGVYSAVENAAMAVGPVIFNYIASENTALRMRIGAGVLLGSLLLFALFSTRRRDAG